MQIKETLLTNNPCYKQGRTITVKGIMLHSVGCNQPFAQVFVNTWNKSSYNRACVHAFIDGNTGVIHQCLPWHYRGWHGGGSSNNTHIGVEMCEPACIKYTSGASFTCSDTATAKAVVTRTYKAAVELFAFLCKKYNLNPLADGVIVSHREGHTRGIATNHGDPEHLWNGLKTGYTMDGFRKAVYAEMNKAASATKPTNNTTETKTLYRIQTGAFSKKENAIALADKLKKKGFDTCIVQSGNIYKVQVGAYNVKASADAMAAKLKAAGYDNYITTNSGSAVSADTKPKKTIDELAREVVNGKWGNGTDRKNRITAAGYDYSAVQKRVNELLK